MSDSLVVSALPRGGHGPAALIALDATTLEPLAVRPLPHHEYLADDTSREATPIEHCRGMAQRDGLLYLAMFNAIGVYEIDDPPSLRMSPRRLLTSYAASDLHGIAVTGDAIYAASTGADAVVRWDRRCPGVDVIALGGACLLTDLRFPRRLAARDGLGDWRDALAARLHINDVAVGPDEELLVCALNRIVRVNGSEHHNVLVDATARFHDAQFSRDGEMIATDAARGTVVLSNMAGTRRRHLQVADPKTWFVRGLRESEAGLIVLRSERVASNQRRVAEPRRESPNPGPARFGVTVLEHSGRLVEQRDFEFGELSAGSVAYAVDRIRATSSDERIPTGDATHAPDRVAMAPRQARAA